VVQTGNLILRLRSLLKEKPLLTQVEKVKNSKEKVDRIRESRVVLLHNRLAVAKEPALVDELQEIFKEAADWVFLHLLFKPKSFQLVTAQSEGFFFEKIDGFEIFFSNLFFELLFNKIIKKEFQIGKIFAEKENVVFEEVLLAPKPCGKGGKKVDLALNWE
jgi:hypothetical protein